MKYYSVFKKKKILSFATTWMELENVVLREMSRAQKDILHIFTYMWNLKQSLVKREQNGGYRGWGVGGMGR